MIYGVSYLGAVLGQRIHNIYRVSQKKGGLVFRARFEVFRGFKSNFLPFAGSLWYKATYHSQVTLNSVTLIRKRKGFMTEAILVLGNSLLSQTRVLLLGKCLNTYETILKHSNIVGRIMMNYHIYFY